MTEGSHIYLATNNGATSYMVLHEPSNHRLPRLIEDATADYVLGLLSGIAQTCGYSSLVVHNGFPRADLSRLASLPVPLSLDELDQLFSQSPMLRDYAQHRW